MEDVLELARALARGEPHDTSRVGELARAPQEALAVLGRALLDLEEREARAASNLVDLRAMLEGLSRTKRELRVQNFRLRSEYDLNLRPVIGAEGGLKSVMRLANKVLNAPIPVLITGETGTGKEVLARYLHGHGDRRDGPFVPINCAALPDTLLESELFGIEKGVATGVGKRPGRFVQASGGTIFLDEIGDMPLPMQAKVLRVLQEHEVVPLGGASPVKVDVRVVSATNQNLLERVDSGDFRQDLYYRLHGVHLALPPLRDRRQDLDELIDHFLLDSSQRFNCKVPDMAPAARQALRGYLWPGNVRELVAELQRALAVSEEGRITPEDLSPHIAAGSRQGRASAERDELVPRDEEGNLLSLKEARKLFEQRYVMEALKATDSRTEAAKLLNLTPEGLRRRLLALDMNLGDGRTKTI